MKTTLLFRNVFLNTFYILLLLCASLSVSAQCPTIADPTPPAICDASGFTFNDLNTYATDGGNGIRWYAVPTGGTAFNPGEFVSQGTYYADDDSGTCGFRESIFIDFTVDPTGQNLDANYCSNENIDFQDYIDNVLQSGIPPGGSVEIYYSFDLVNQVAPATLFPNGLTNLAIVFVAAGGVCKSQFETSRVGVFASPQDPMPDLIQAFCANAIPTPTVGSLQTGTPATNFNWYSSLDAFDNPIEASKLSSSDPLTSGIYYIQIDDGSCTSNAVAVTVNVDVPVDAGSSDTLRYCEDNIPAADFNLFDELGGFPQTGGNWTTNSSLAITNGHLGTVNISTLIAGTYVFTYTISGGGACPDGISTVTIIISPILSSGTPSGANRTFCVSGLPSNFDLMTLLDTDADLGGVWTEGLSSSGTVVPSSIDLTTGAFTPASSPYNFTYSQNTTTPCPEDSTTIQIVVLADPNAGTATNDTFCENALIANYNLFNALDGSQDNNLGIWTDATNATISDPLNLDITSFTVGGSPYTFNYTIDNGTCSDTETISITIEDAPNAGTTTNPNAFCLSDITPGQTLDLSDYLSVDADPGVWSDDTPSNRLSGSIVTLDGLLPGTTYSFTFDVTAFPGCDTPEMPTVLITINAQPDTGAADPAIYCENDLALNNTAFDLFTLLTGTVDAGGQWYLGTDSAGTMISNVLDLNTLTNIQVYDYTYSITDINGCINSTTTSITIEDAPNAGTTTNPNAFCVADITSGQTLDLLDYLSVDADPGIWIDDTPSNQLTGSTVRLDNLLPGTTYSFTFDVTAIDGCDAPEMPTVLITINAQPNTGTADPATYCENNPALNNTSFNLFTLLTGTVDAGGQWYLGTDTTGTAITNILDLNTLTNIQVYNYTYSITDINGCTNNTTTSITIEDAPNAGTTTNPNAFCVADITPGQTLDLLDYLSVDADPGVWIDDTPSNQLTGSTVRLDNLLPGTTYSFTFDVTAIDGCDAPEMPMVTITINDSSAPTANATQEFCDTATVGDLTVLTGTTIQWYDDATGGTPLAGTVTLIDGENYFATQTDGTTGCESSVRTEVIARIYQSPNAGVSVNPGISECNNTTINLFDGLDGSQDNGGTWYEGPDNTGAVVSTPTTYDVTGFSANNYQFTYYITASAPCVDDSTTITVTIDEPLSAGTDNTLDACSTDATTDLFTLLGAADPGGTWSPALTSGTGVFDPTVDAGDIYTYTHTNACGVTRSEVIVTVTQAPNAGTSNPALICVIDGPTDLFTFLGGADTLGTWSPALASGTGVFDPLVDTAGVYRYTVTANSPCAIDATADITVTVSDSSPPIVNNATMEFCLIDNPTVADLDAALTATGTITWYEDAALTTQLNATDTLVDGEDYYATQTNASGCESSTNVQVDVIVNDTPTPTLDNLAAEYCINDGPIINDLSLNITEYNASTSNIVWYDAASNGSVISDSSTLNHNVTYYAALVDGTTGCESSVRLAITTDLTSCGKLILPDGFSPNGDGTNDTYDFDNLHILYPNFVIEIFNRYGNIVYKGNANTPRFDGISNQSRTIGSGDLPVGVYYYIFNFNDGENKPEQGRLYLSR
ncbi:gliding motility-associated C-terminal domain-containing protein [Flavivirga spongiicola]|uniref:Gliding motility-associated C-terminal domain-containing protein n=1 Tax=Flavivirga spongiicola TaxID=421621 RepID=A0ABU7XUG5_9FLAO|nr:gliding motility-associated C-terminal domain-containing protein [Flavivirga sp. MEBiC05379]MDO5979419.1 gliding motility-associated C-terminal domain-containing protein [Flavivirga sp. MEBiC05379]